METPAAVNRPPTAHPGPNAGNQHICPNNNSVPNPARQDPGLQSTSQDPGPAFHPQHQISARPIFYVPAPPPPPFLHYQWPMPFTYNPFGFPGMGYGMVIPPFPPPSYMDAPAYILPPPHIQPVDYRRLLHPQIHIPSAPFQNPNQSRRIRLPHSAPGRETVNSEVQTEPMRSGRGGYSDGSPLISSDSGQGTASNSPSFSSSSSQKRGSAENENYTLTSSNSKDIQVNDTCVTRTVKHSFNIKHPARTTAFQSCIRATLETQKSHTDSDGQQNVCTCRDCNVCLVSSLDSLVPRCSSSQEDDVVKERRISVPDILMSWGGGTPQATEPKRADKVLSQNGKLPGTEEHEKHFYQSPAVIENGTVVADVGVHDNAVHILRSKDCETCFKILKLPFTLQEFLSESRGENETAGPVRHCLPFKDKSLHFPNKDNKIPDDEQENPHEETSEIVPYQMSFSGSRLKKKMDESVWSVESIAPFIPTNEWLLQNGVFAPEVIVEMTEEAENGRRSTQNDSPIVESNKERRESHRFSSTDSVPMSDSWLLFSTPGPSMSKKPERESEIKVSEKFRTQHCQNMGPLEKDALASLPHLLSEVILSTPKKDDAGKNLSTEPESNPSLNQEARKSGNEQQEKTPCSEQKETPFFISAAGEEILSTGQLILQTGKEKHTEDEAHGNEENNISQLRSEQLCVLMADQKMEEVCLSKDCSTQCALLECICEGKDSMGQSRRHPHKYLNTKKANNEEANRFFMNGHMQKNQRRHHQRNRGPEKQSSQQETYNGYGGKPWKQKRVNGRIPRY